MLQANADQDDKYQECLTKLHKFFKVTQVRQFFKVTQVRHGLTNTSCNNYTYICATDAQSRPWSLHVRTQNVLGSAVALLSILENGSHYKASL